jgi:hypothetical protein
LGEAAVRQRAAIGGSGDDGVGSRVKRRMTVTGPSRLVNVFLARLFPSEEKPNRSRAEWQCLLARIFREIERGCSCSDSCVEKRFAAS